MVTQRQKEKEIITAFGSINWTKPYACVVSTNQLEFPDHQDSVITFARSINNNKANNIELDPYWLLIYQLFAKGKIKYWYNDDNTFRVLRKNNVSFIKFPLPLP